MSQRSRIRIILWGILGVVLGLAGEWGTHHFDWPFVIRDGVMWGGVLGLVVGYLPNFAQMGAQVTRQGNRAVNLLVGVGVFLVVSTFVIGFIMGVFWIVGRAWAGGA